MNLKNVKHLNKFRRLKYPKNEMLIVGSGVLALLGLKENKDLDVWTTPRIMKQLLKDEKFVHTKSQLDRSVMVESKDGTLEFGTTLPPFKNLKEHLRRALIVYGIHFQSPKDVLEWKKYMNRPKDKVDIIALEKYLSGDLAEYFLNSLWMLR